MTDYSFYSKIFNQVSTIMLEKSATILSIIAFCIWTLGIMTFSTTTLSVMKFWVPEH